MAVLPWAAAVGCWDSLPQDSKTHVRMGFHRARGSPGSILGAGQQGPPVRLGRGSLWGDADLRSAESQDASSILHWRRAF